MAIRSLLIYQRNYCLHLHDWRVSHASSKMKWKQYVPLKHQWTTTMLHGVTPQKNLILCSHPYSGLSVSFSYQTYECISLLTHVCYMLYPFHPLWFYFSNDMSWGGQIMKFLTMLLSPVTFSSLQLFYPSQVQKLSLVHVLPSMWYTKLHNHTKLTIRKIIVLYIYLFNF
jgi:hypothetical protein